VILLAIKTVVRTYPSVIKLSHDYKDFSTSSPMGDDWRVIEVWVTNVNDGK